jgi:hypothetical protein
MRLAIIHFNPIERYPPVMNWLNYLAGHMDGKTEVLVLTMASAPGEGAFPSPAPFIRIKRVGNLNGRSAVSRYRNYLAFYASAIGRLAGWRPDAVLYYETLSAYPAILYKRIINRDSRLFVHYHEYMSPKEYQEGMTLIRWGHKLEKRAYPSYAWISHTNEDRMGMFMEDLQGIRLHHTHILPNYPPLSWRSEKRENGVGSPVRLVYAGALSLETMYTRVFTDWILRQEGKVVLDIYSGNMSGETGEFLSMLNSPHIRFCGRVDYFDLPRVLRNYDAGVILYNGNIPNYVYNVPNKFYEYWACGLDVWFPEKMKSSLALVTTDSYPKIVAIDFEKLETLNLGAMTDRTGLLYRPCPYYDETSLEPLLAEVCRNCR